MKRINKNIKRLLVLIFATLLITACTEDKSPKVSGGDLSITYKIVSDEEKHLIQHSGGIEAQHFEMKGDISDSQVLELTIEQYEKGELIQGEPNTRIDNEQYEGSGDISFAIGTASGYGSNKAIIGLPGGSVTLDLQQIEDGGSAFGTVTEEKVNVKLNEPVYLAFWVSTADGSLSTPNFFEVETPDMKEYDNGFLFKAELKEK